MEVEVKLRLPDAEAHQKVASLLEMYHKKTHMQENFFFDGSRGELSAKRAVLRFRFYDENARCVVTLKGKAIIVDGISKAEEVEEDVDVSIGRECVQDPTKIVSLDCSILKKVIKDFDCHDFECLGGFKNVRSVFHWEGETLELDESTYTFGTTFEIECETPDPERIRPLLCEFLEANGIPHSYSTCSKFAIFRSGKLPE